MHRAWGSVIISDGERAVWTGGGRAVHYREKAAPFKALASVELQPRARAQLLGLAAEYDQLAEMRPPGTSPRSLILLNGSAGDAEGSPAEVCRLQGHGSARAL